MQTFSKSLCNNSIGTMRKNSIVSTVRRRRRINQEQKIAEYEDVLVEIFANCESEMKKSQFKDRISEVMGVKKSSAYSIINFMLIVEDEETRVISRVNVAV
ncbi:MAG: hypothetical protein ACI81T_002812 [Bacteroidia bacterium]|jgi:hypothetical protein